MLNINIHESDFDILFMFLDLDGSNRIDYKEFGRKLRRMGVVLRSKEEEAIHILWNAIQRGGFTLT
jgi:Ca2+-binding EF-hand superfamily protein